MKKFIKKLYVLATLSMAPLALNNFNKPTFAMESSNSYNNFNEIKQNYEAELKTVNEEIQATITEFKNEINSTSNSNNLNDNINDYQSPLTICFNNMKQASFKKCRLMNKTIVALNNLTAISMDKRLGKFIKDMGDDIVETTSALQNWHLIYFLVYPQSSNQKKEIIFDCFKKLLDKIQDLLKKLS